MVVCKRCDRNLVIPSHLRAGDYIKCQCNQWMQIAEMPCIIEGCTCTGERFFGVLLPNQKIKPKIRKASREQIHNFMAEFSGWEAFFGIGAFSEMKEKEVAAWKVADADAEA